MTATPEEACKKAIEFMGGARRVAERFGVSAQAVYKWDMIPARKVLDVESETGISRHELRPDVFGEQEMKRAGESSA